MTDAVLPTDSFPASSREDWTALVRKTLKGGDPDRLTRRTADGLLIEPLYQGRADAVGVTRRATTDERHWDVRTRVAHPDPERANQQALSDLGGGAASLLLAVDPAGTCGTAIPDADSLKRAIDGVLLDLAPVALDAGFSGPVAAGWLGEAAQSTPNAPLAFHLDPLSALAEQGAAEPIESALADAARTAAQLGADFPAASLFLASGRAVHEAGGSEAQELGFALAAALAYAKALDAAGPSPAATLPRIVLGVSLDAEPALNIAKLRAARLAWSRLASACGAGAVVSVEARSSRRMLAKLDPWTNLLRLTAAGFAGATGGADAIVLGAFTDPLGEPTDFARRQARNIQLVLMEEAHLGRVSDPAAGSGLIEALTDQLAREAWRVFQAIEARGGAAAALTDGWLAAEVARARAARQTDYTRRKAGLIGVTEFPDLNGAPVEVEPVARPSPAASAAPLLPSVRWAEPFEALRERGEALDTPVALVLLGPPAEHAARAGFARTLLAVAGLRTVDANTETANTPLAVLCGSDERYAAEAESAARTLKAAGVPRIWLAGRPGENEPALRGAGVDRFVFAGADVIEPLEDALSALRARGKVPA